MRAVRSLAGSITWYERKQGKRHDYSVNPTTLEWFRDELARRFHLDDQAVVN